MQPSENTGKVMSTRIKNADGVTLILRYRKAQAYAMRALVQSIRLNGKTPSLSVIARRAMSLYLASLEANPELLTQEVAELELMVTPIPQPAKMSKKKPA